MRTKMVTYQVQNTTGTSKNDSNSKFDRCTELKKKEQALIHEDFIPINAIKLELYGSFWSFVQTRRRLIWSSMVVLF